MTMFRVASYGPELYNSGTTRVVASFAMTVMTTLPYAINIPSNNITLSARWSPQEPRLAHSNLVEVDGFYSGRKSPENKSSEYEQNLLGVFTS